MFVDAPLQAYNGTAVYLRCLHSDSTAPVN